MYFCKQFLFTEINYYFIKNHVSQGFPFINSIISFVNNRYTILIAKHETFKYLEVVFFLMIPIISFYQDINKYF